MILRRAFDAAMKGPRASGRGEEGQVRHQPRSPARKWNGSWPAIANLPAELMATIKKTFALKEITETAHFGNQGEGPSEEAVSPCSYPSRPGKWLALRDWHTAFTPLV